MLTRQLRDAGVTSWAFMPSEGVGLEFTGFPDDPDEFVFAMGFYGCHPVAGHRILRRLADNGVDRLTVLSSLPFSRILALTPLFGVTSRIIDPQPGWRHLFDDEAWPEDFMHDIQLFLAYERSRVREEPHGRL